jgi:hypothetical protein
LTALGSWADNVRASLGTKQSALYLQGSSKLASFFCTGLQHQCQARQRYCASRLRRSQSEAQWMLAVDDASTYCGSFGGTPTAHSQTPHTTRGNSLPEGEPSWPTRSDAQTSGEREKLSPKLSPNYSQPVAIDGIATFSVAKKRTPSRIRAWGSCGLGGRGCRGDGVPPDPVTSN